MNKFLSAQLNSGQQIVPGDNVTVRTEGARMWGNRVRRTPDALIELEGVVSSITFEQNEEGSIVWKGLADVQIPIEGSDRTFLTSVEITTENCVPQDPKIDNK